MNSLEEPLNLENRRKLYSYISQHPGTFVREIERELNMPPGLVSYHLLQLERSQLIRSEDDGYRRTFFPASGFQQKDRRTIATLRQESPRGIILNLLAGERSFQDLQMVMRISKSTLSHHLKKLTNTGLLKSEKKERESYYRLSDPEYVTNVLIAIKDTLDQDAVKSFAEIWSKLGTK